MTKFSRLALGAALLSLPFVSPANAIVWPSIGADTLGPAIIITIGPGAVQTITNGPGAGQGPYDLVEDTYIGVVNNSGASISQVSLSAPSNIGIFGFDGDGIGAGTGAGNATYPAGCAANGAGACGTANSNDSLSGGYGGPIGFFSNILLGDGSSNTNDTGIFNIAGNLADGGFTWFSLEEPLSVCSGNLCVVTPLPGALPLFATGLGALGLLGLRRRRRAVAV